MNYNIDFFISKFEAIPEELFGTGGPDITGRQCTMFHCGYSGSRSFTEESDALNSLILSICKISMDSDGEHAKRYWPVAMLNDGRVSKYQQPTTKQRILAALYDIKKMQAPTIKEVEHVGEFIPITFSQIEELQSAN